MKNLTLANIAAATGGSYSGPQSALGTEVTAISTDSRQVPQGGLFVAIKGERVDGHRFIPQVMQGGALAALGEEPAADATVPYIQVASSLQAVQDVARFYLRQLAIPVVGIAGSVGKTSTKEMTWSVLSQKFRTLKTQGNFNNELGVPLTIFRLRESDEMAVIEMGISHFGEMHRLASIVRPNTVIMTNIGEAHLENLHTRDGILKAKSEIFDFMTGNEHIIVNGDDDKLVTLRQVHGITPLRYGLGEGNDYRALDLQPLGLHGTRCRIVTPIGAIEQVTVPIPGQHQVMNALAATAAGVTYGLTLDQIKAGIESAATIAGRFNIIHTPRLTIIDDCYNASPASMEASLQLLQSGTGRRVAILGDMGELGDNTRELHAQVGRYAATLHIDALYCAGELCQALAQEAAANPRLDVRHFATRDQLMAALPSLLHPGDTVLVKASHFMQFSTIVEQLHNA